MRKSKSGFTLAELLIVVAIIAVLVAISIPVFTNQLEKARRAVDLHTARTIESVLANAVNDGTIQFPSNITNSSNYGVYIMISRDKSCKPKGYPNLDKPLFCGADQGVAINGNISGKWDVYDPNVQSLLTNSGINIDSLKVSSKTAKNGGWDWIIINVGYVKNAGFITRIYSGNNSNQGNAELGIGTTSIEALIKKQT